MLPQLTNTADLSNEEKLNRYDYILFIIVFICPYTDSGVWWMLTSFIPLLSTLGSSILAFALSLYLFQYAYRHHYKVKARNLYGLIWIAVIWTLFKFVTTIFTIGLSEGYHYISQELYSITFIFTVYEVHFKYVYHKDGNLCQAGT